MKREHEWSRRDALKAGGIIGAGMAAFGPAHAQAAAQGANPGARQDNAGGVLADRDFVIAAGMTEAEAECWETIAKAAGQYFNLPEDHPMDRQEVASAIHIVQNKLLSRPTYRKYLELAKAAHEARNKQ